MLAVRDMRESVIIRSTVSFLNMLHAGIGLLLPVPVPL